jgi:NADH:ubiquinone oxidoreductase subunit 5 (subunit L)/multisubunit Na+/H+ antiporter MnhA subunit
MLVNFYSTRVYTIKAALKTFVFSRISDMFLFLAFMLAVVVLNTTDLSIMFLQAPIISFHYMGSGKLTTHFLTAFTYCIVVSGTIKSAQFLAHV